MVFVDFCFSSDGNFDQLVKVVTVVLLQGKVTWVFHCGKNLVGRYFETV